MEVGPADPLMDSGIDSLAGIELKNKVEAMYGVEFPPPPRSITRRRLARYLAAKIKKEEEENAGEDGGNRREHRRPRGCRRLRGLAECRGVSAIWSSANPRGSSSGSIVGSILGWAASAPPARARRRGPDALRVPRRHLHARLGPMGPRPAGASDPSEAPTVAAASSGRFGVGSWRGRDSTPAFGVSLAESSLMDPQQTSPRSRRVARSVSHIPPAFAAAAGLPGARLLRGLVAAAVKLSVVDYLSRRPGRGRARPESASARETPSPPRAVASRTRSGSEARVSRSTHRVFVASSPRTSRETPSPGRGPRRVRVRRSHRRRRRRGRRLVFRRTPRAYSPPRVLAPPTVDVRRWTPTRTDTFERKPCGRCLVVDDPGGVGGAASPRRRR